VYIATCFGRREVLVEKQFYFWMRVYFDTAYIGLLPQRDVENKGYWVGPRGRLEVLERRKILFPAGMRNPDRPACRLVTISTTLSQVHIKIYVLITTMHSLRSALFWDSRRRRVVIVCRRFGTTYRSYLQGSWVRDHVVSQKGAQHIKIAAEAWNQGLYIFTEYFFSPTWRILTF
jgi:hypothetical protein